MWRHPTGGIKEKRKKRPINSARGTSSDLFSGIESNRRRRQQILSSISATEAERAGDAQQVQAEHVDPVRAGDAQHPEQTGVPQEVPVQQVVSERAGDAQDPEQAGVAQEVPAQLVVSERAVDAHTEEEVHDGAAHTETGMQQANFRFRRSLLLPPAKPSAQRKVIRPKGKTGWVEIGWDGRGHRTIVNSVLGRACRYYYPGLVQMNGQIVPATKWQHWKMKNYRGDKNHSDMVWDTFWEQYRLEEGKSLDDPELVYVFNSSAYKVVKDTMCDARVKAVTIYYKKVKKIEMTNEDAAKIHLTTDEYLQSEVDWLTQHEDAWPRLCEMWGSERFKAISDRNHENRKSKPGVHCFGADGHIGKAQRMEGVTGVPPSVIEVYMEGHKGSDPNRPEILCDDNATEKLSRYANEMQKRHGPEVDWMKEPVDLDAVYVAGGGLPHGRLAICDGILDHRSCSNRLSTSSVGTDRPRQSTREDELVEQLKTTQHTLNTVVEQMSQLQTQQMMRDMWMQQMFGGAMPFQGGRPPFEQPSIVTRRAQSEPKRDVSQGLANSAEVPWRLPLQGSQPPPIQPGMGFWPFGFSQFGFGSQGMPFGRPPFVGSSHHSSNEGSTSRHDIPHAPQDTPLNQDVAMNQEVGNENLDQSGGVQG